MALLESISGLLYSNSKKVALEDSKGLATAWVAFTWDGAVINILDSLNVASVSRTAVGQFNIDMTSIDNLNYNLTTGSVYTSGYPK